MVSVERLPPLKLQPAPQRMEDQLQESNRKVTRCAPPSPTASAPATAAAAPAPAQLLHGSSLAVLLKSLQTSSMRAYKPRISKCPQNRNRKPVQGPQKAGAQKHTRRSACAASRSQQVVGTTAGSPPTTGSMLVAAGTEHCVIDLACATVGSLRDKVTNSTEMTADFTCIGKMDAQSVDQRNMRCVLRAVSCPHGWCFVPDMGASFVV